MKLRTLIDNINYIELVFAWGFAVGFGLAVAVIMGGPAYLNPGVVLGNVVVGALSIADAGIYLLMEFLAAGAAVIFCTIFFRLKETRIKKTAVHKKKQ